MKTIYFTGDIQNVHAGLFCLQQKLDFKISPLGEKVHLIKSSKNSVHHKKNKGAQITYSEPSCLFRSLNLLFSHWNEPNYIFDYPVYFEQVGPMLDASRNAVPSVAKIKEIIETIAILGLNQLMLYMEDTYTIPEYPYFGYLRGRYTANELKEIDDYGYKLGVEVIPAIQVLGHLKNPLKWNFANQIKDTEDILMVNEPKTYAFLEKAIQAVSLPFRTNKIHIGMDEAQQLGLGNYLQKHGLADRFQLMNDHLKKIIEITGRLGLEVEMWSDMYFRLASSTGDYYQVDQVIPSDIIRDIPEVSMVYWDYYHHSEAEYLELLEKHKELQKPIIFAGGIWTWNGLAPNYGKSIATTNAALKACKKEAIQRIYITLWGDDGAETPFDTCLLGLQLFAEHRFSQDVSPELLAKRFSELQGESAEAFLLLDSFDQTEGVTPENPEGSAVSKLIFYQDPLLGLYDQTIAPFLLSLHYEDLVKKLEDCSTTKKSQAIFIYYQLLAKTLVIKTDLGNQLKQLYQEKDKSGSLHMISRIQQLQALIEELKIQRRNLWFHDNKSYGWEILDIRFGGIQNRLESTIWRLEEWIDHDQAIEELEADRLPFDGPYPMPEGIIGRNLYHGIISPSKLSDV